MLFLVLCFVFVWRIFGLCRRNSNNYPNPRSDSPDSKIIERSETEIDLRAVDDGYKSAQIRNGTSRTGCWVFGELEFENASRD